MASRGQLPVIPSLWSLEQPENGQGRHEDTLDLAKGVQHESSSLTDPRAQKRHGEGGGAGGLNCVVTGVR